MCVCIPIFLITSAYLYQGCKYIFKVSNFRSPPEEGRVIQMQSTYVGSQGLRLLTRYSRAFRSLARCADRNSWRGRRSSKRSIISFAAYGRGAWVRSVVRSFEPKNPLEKSAFVRTRAAPGGSYPSSAACPSRARRRLLNQQTATYLT